MGLFDSVEASRMPLGDHLEELRFRMWRALLGFSLCLVLVLLVDLIGFTTDTRFGIARPAFGFLTAPVEQELQRHQARLAAELRERLGDVERTLTVRVDAGQAFHAWAQTVGVDAPAWPVGEERLLTLNVRLSPQEVANLLDDTRHTLARPAQLKVLGPGEGMFVYLKVALMCGILLGSPWVFFQFWAFVAAGLYSHERRLVHVYLPFSLLLFFLGVALCQIWVMPATLQALFGFDAWLNLEPDLRLSEWLNFALLMPLAFGLAFQTPLILWCLDRLGIVDVETFQRHRKLACFLMALGAAVATPGVDLYSMLFLWLPLMLLYEAGIWLCRLSPRQEAALVPNAFPFSPPNLVDKEPE